MAPLGKPGSSENPEYGTSSSPNPSADSARKAPLSRRALRAAESSKRSSSSAASTPPPKTTSRDVASRSPQASQKNEKRKLRGGVFNITVMTLAAGLIATMALPAYAFNPETEDEGQFGASVIDNIRKTDSQAVTVAATSVNPVVKRDQVTATSEAELQAQQAREEAQQAREAAAAEMEAYAASYSGPSVSDFLAKPSYPSFSLGKVFSVAQQYVGTPYVYGGASPAGFDCSGYIMFVYAQFGISLPHSVSGQAARGTRISIDDAVPGDVVIMPGHDGFYAGNGNIMDAPDTGRSISVRPIWTDNFYIVRLGI